MDDDFLKKRDALFDHVKTIAAQNPQEKEGKKAEKASLLRLEFVLVAIVVVAGLVLWMVLSTEPHEGAIHQEGLFNTAVSGTPEAVKIYNVETQSAP